MDYEFLNEIDEAMGTQTQDIDSLWAETLAQVKKEPVQILSKSSNLNAAKKISDTNSNIKQKGVINTSEEKQNNTSIVYKAIQSHRKRIKELPFPKKTYVIQKLILSDQAEKYIHAIIFVFLFLVLLFSTAALVAQSFNPFLYFRF